MKMKTDKSIIFVVLFALFILTIFIEPAKATRETRELSEQGPAGIPRLIELLDSREPGVRADAMNGLSQIESPEILEPLRKMAEEDSDVIVRVIAIFNLYEAYERGTISGEELEPIFLNALKDPSGRVRAISAQKYSHVTAEKFDKLISQKPSKVDEVEELIKPLIDALRRECQLTPAERAEQTDGIRKGDPVWPEEYALVYIRKTLSAKSLVDILNKYLTNESESKEFRYTIAAAIIDAGQKGLSRYIPKNISEEFAIEALENSTSGNTRLIMTKHLGEIGSKRAFPALKNALNDDYHRYTDKGGYYTYRVAISAQYALEKLGVIVELPQKGRFERPRTESTIALPSLTPRQER